MDIAIRGGMVYVGSRFVESDVGIQGNRIERVGQVGSAREEIDASGCFVIPGLVNTHTHSPMTLLRGLADGFPVRRWFREDIQPVEERMTAEDVYNGSRLAIAEMLLSGTTAFGEMYFEEEAILRAIAESGIRARIGFGMSNEKKPRVESEEQFDRAKWFVTHVREEFAPRVTPMITPHATDDG